MKKLICVFTLLALVLSFCACGQEPVEETTAATEPSVEATTEELSGGHQYDTEIAEATKPDCSGINEFEPNEDGVYQIHTPEGLLNMVNHPDAKFELLWHIDMGGASWTPVGTKAQPFTGKIEGGYFTVSNFVIEQTNEDGDMGFFGTFAGQVKELTLKDVTITTTADTQRAGLWCAHNDDGQFLRCGNETSSLAAAQMAANAAIGALVGVNEGEFRNGTMDVSLTVTAAGKADVGGMAGYAADGKIQFIKNNGFIEVTGSDKNVGLFAGAIEKDAQITGCVYLGEKNTVDGVLYENYTGTGDREKVTECLYRDNDRPERDPLDAEKRAKAVAYMKEMGTYSWYVSEDTLYGCTPNCKLNSCFGYHRADYEQKGIKYNHKGSSFEALKYCLDENGYMKEEYRALPGFDGWDVYIGNDCSTSIRHALWTIVATPMHDRYWCYNFLPNIDTEYVPIGMEMIENPGSYTDSYMLANGEQGVYEAYALCWGADVLYQAVEAGGHLRMIADEAVVVRNEEGLIDGMESYLIVHEQGAPRTHEPYYSSWRIDYHYSFNTLYLDWFIPIRHVNMENMNYPDPEVWLEKSATGRAGMTTGIAYSNMNIDSGGLQIFDAEGNEVFERRLFTNSARWHDDQGREDLNMRKAHDDFDLGQFAVPLSKFMMEPGETYSYKVTIYSSTGETFVVAEDTFTNGTAK